MKQSDHLFFFFFFCAFYCSGRVERDDECDSYDELKVNFHKSTSKVLNVLNSWLNEAV